MPTYEFRCDQCGCIVEQRIDAPIVGGFVAPHPQCGHVDCGGKMRRVWSTFHTGQGSSGERPK